MALVHNEQEGDEGDVNVENDLPPEFHYLREIDYNQPRSPRRGDVIKYFNFNYEGWLRVRVVSKHKKLSNYAGSVNCMYLDINREPDGLYFARGDFWSILENPEDDPEVSVEVVREELERQSEIGRFLFQLCLLQQLLLAWLQVCQIVFL